MERLNISEAMKQSQRDARPGELPAVFHRRNREEWLVTMPLGDWIELYQRFVAVESCLEAESNATNKTDQKEV